MDSERRQELQARLRSIEGHVRGLRRMLEQGSSCLDIVRQIQAVQGALDRVVALLLEHHLDTCLAAAIRGDDPAERERVLRDLLAVLPGVRSSPRPTRSAAERRGGDGR